MNEIGDSAIDLRLIKYFTTKDKLGLVPLPPDFVWGAGKLTQLKQDFINTISEIQLNISAFENIMARYFRAIIVETEKQNSNLKEKSWWSKFIEITEQIEQRLKQKP